MQKSILITLLLVFTALFSTAQTPKIAFIDWDSIHNEVNLYKINEIEVAQFKAFVMEKDSLNINQLKMANDSFIYKYNHDNFSSSTLEILVEKLRSKQKKAIEFDKLISKSVIEFESKSKELTDDLIKLKIRYYIDYQDFKIIDSNKNLIELINKDDNLKYKHAYDLKFLMNKIKFDYNLE